MALRTNSRLHTVLTTALMAVAVVQVDADGFLAAGTGGHARKVRLSQRASQEEDRLRVDAAHLAAALRTLVGNCPHGKCPTSVVSAARDRLGQEASLLQNENPQAAALLSSYAQNAPPTVLLMPVDTPSMPTSSDEVHKRLEKQQSSSGEQQPQASAQTMATASSEYEESLSEPDGNGHVVVRTVNCKDGRCVQRMQRSTLPKDASNPTSLGSEGDSLPASTGVSNSQEEPLTGSWPGIGRSMMSPLSSAVRAMAQDMERVHQSFGRDSFGFDDFIKDAFKERKMPDWDDFNPGLDSMDLGTGQGEELKASDKDNQAKTVEPLSASHSTDTRISNGRLVTRTRRCQNGDCETRIVEHLLAPSKQSLNGEPLHT